MDLGYVHVHVERADEGADREQPSFSEAAGSVQFQELSGHHRHSTLSTQRAARPALVLRHTLLIRILLETAEPTSVSSPAPDVIIS